MRARPNLSGDQLVTDYLTRVAQASRLLPKGARIAFVGRTRALLEREVGPPGTRTDPGHVREVLAKLGKPEDLVIAERTRIDQGWVKSRAATKAEGEAAAAALTGPRTNRPLTARRRPNSDAQPLFGRPVPARGAGAPGAVPPGARSPDAVSPGARPAGARSPGAVSPGARPAGARSPGGAPGSAAPGSARPGSPGPRRLRSADSPAGHPPGANSRGTAPRGANPQAASSPGSATANNGHSGTIDRLAGQAPGRRGAAATGPLTASAARLARDNLLETVAVLLTGLGGLILPFPFWLIGATVAMFSKVWDVKDKTLAVVGPLLVTLVASVLAAVFVGGSGNVIVVYFHGLHVAFGALLRVGSVVTAAYLAWRIVKGPRPKVPPWKRITR